MPSQPDPSPDRETRATAIRYAFADGLRVALERHPADYTLARAFADGASAHADDLHPAR